MGILSSLFGIGGSKPSTSTVVQQQNIPKELAPFIKEILGEAQTLYKADIERGYDPYTGLTTAPFTPEQEAAQEGISGLVGTTAPFLAEAFDIYQEGAEKFTPEVAQEYMSPYQRAVTDIEKREAQTQFERTALPTFEKRAVDAGGMSGLGTRAGVEAAEMQRGQSQLLADIEAKGLQSAYQDARLGFEQQKAREQQMAGNIGRTGPALFQAGLAERGAQMGVGEQKREAAQSELDEAYFKFLEERGFPQQTLTDYSQTVYGSPLSKQPFGTTRTETSTPFVSSPGSQLMGLGLGGLNIYGMGGGFGVPTPGKWNPANFYSNMQAKQGGQINPRGLSGLPVVRRAYAGGVGGGGYSRSGVPNMSFSSSGAMHRGSPLQANFSETMIDVMNRLRGPDYSDPNIIRDTITADIDRTGYFDPAKRAIPSKLKLAEIKNAALLAKEGRQNISRTALEEARKARGEHFTDLKKRTGLVNVTKKVGEHLQKPVPPGTTIIEQASQFLGAVGEAAGEQMLEGAKERAELTKEQYTEEQSERATEAERLTKESDLEYATSIELIKGEFDLKELLAKLPIEKQKQINSEINTKLGLENLTLAKLNTMATFLKALGDMNKAKGGDKGGKAYVAAQRIMNAGVAREHEVLLTYDANGNVTGMKRPDGSYLDNTDPDFIRVNRKLYEKDKLFLDMLTKEGVLITQQNIAIAQKAAQDLDVFDPPDETFELYRQKVIPLKETNPKDYKVAIKRLAQRYYNGNLIAAEAFLNYWIGENPL